MMSKFNLQLLTAVSLAVALLQPAVARAQVFDKDYSDTPDGGGVLKGSVGLFSDRVFRGQNLYDGTSIQTAGKAGIGTEFGLLYVGAFAHFSDDTNNGAENEQSFNEFDFEVGDRFYFLEDIETTLGHRWYTYSRTTARLQDTNQFFAEIRTDVIAHPFFSANYDYDEHDGWYYEFGLEQPVLLGLDNEKNAIVPSVTIGVSSSLDGGNHPIYDDDGIAFVDVGLKGILVLTDALNLEPEIHYSEDVDDATTSELTFGMNLVGSIGEK